MKKVLFGASLMVLMACGGGGTDPLRAFDPNKFAGTYVGTWHNLTFSTTGGATLDFSGTPGTKTATANLTFTGNVFGAPSPSPLVLTGNYKGSVFTGTTAANPTFGDVTMQMDSAGSIVGHCTNVPGGTVSSMDFTGTAIGKDIKLTYNVALVSGGTAIGQVNMSMP